MGTPTITVIGSGVIGLSIAHDLALRGYGVTIVADVDTHDTVSALAAALWFPYKSENSPAALKLLERSLTRFTDLAADSTTGVVLRTGTVAERNATPDRGWAGLTASATEATREQLPPGTLSGVRATLPLIVTPTYLGWLLDRVRGLGVTFEHRTVLDVSECEADLVVVAAGIRGGTLLGDDDSVFPVRGQVVRMTNPGLTEWITDTDNSDAVTYVFPRIDDVVVGGVSTAHDWSLEIDPAQESAFLERAVALVPALAGQRILSRSAGLRPARPTIRLEPVPGHLVPVIAAYGHGGSGVTLSWGTAERVVELVDAVLAN